MSSLSVSILRRTSQNYREQEHPVENLLSVNFAPLISFHSIEYLITLLKYKFKDKNKANKTQNHNVGRMRFRIYNIKLYLFYNEAIVRE